MRYKGGFFLYVASSDYARSKDFVPQRWPYVVSVCVCVCVTRGKYFSRHVGKFMLEDSECFLNVCDSVILSFEISF